MSECTPQNTCVREDVTLRHLSVQVDALWDGVVNHHKLLLIDFPAEDFHQSTEIIWENYWRHDPTIHQALIALHRLYATAQLSKDVSRTNDQ